MADVKFACPGCRLHIKVGVEYVGAVSNCPDCDQVLRVPAPPDEVKFACGGCQSKIALHRSYIGSKIECPGCSAKLVVPDPNAKAGASAAPAPAKPKSVAPAKSVTPADRVPVGGSAVVQARGPRTSPPGTRPRGPRTRPPGIRSCFRSARLAAGGSGTGRAGCRD